MTKISLEAFNVKFITISNIKMAFKLNNIIKSIYTNPKDKYDIEQKNNVVYKVNCNDCEKVYIGQTSKNLETRLLVVRRTVDLASFNLIYDMMGWGKY